MSDNRPIQPVDLHIQETVLHHENIRRAEHWRTVRLTVLYTSFAILILAIAFYIFMRTFYPHTYIIQTKDQLVSEVTEKVQRDIGDIVYLSVNDTTRKIIQESVDSSLKNGMQETLENTKQESLAIAKQAVNETLETAIQKASEKTLENAQPKLQQMIQENTENITKKVDKKIAESQKNIDDVIQKASEKTLENAKPELQKMVQENAKAIAKQTDKKITESQKNIDDAIQKASQQALENAKPELQKMVQNALNENLDDIIKKTAQETLKQQPSPESIKELEKQTKKDVITNFTFFKKQRLDENGFGQVVTAWDYKSSADLDKPPYVQRCYTQKNKTTIDLARIENGNNIPMNNPTLYKHLNINADFEDKARKLCVFYESN